MNMTITFEWFGEFARVNCLCQYAQADLPGIRVA